MTTARRIHPIPSTLLALGLLAGLAGCTAPATNEPPSGEPAASQPAAEGPTDHLRGVLLHSTRMRQALEADDPAAARRHLSAALELAPRHPALLYRLAALDARAGESAAGVATLEHIARLGGVFDPAADEAFAAMADDAGLRAVAQRLREPREQPGAQVVVTLEDAELWPEGIAYDPVESALYVGSMSKNKIVRVDAQGHQEDFASEGLMELLGMAVDAERRHLWAVSGEGPLDMAPAAGSERRRNAVVQFELESGRQLAAVELADDGRNRFLNDLGVAPDGTVYVTGSNFGELHRIVPGSGELTLFQTFAELNYLNGIDVSADGRRLYVAHLEGVTTVDLATGEAERVEVEGDLFLGNGDGLYWSSGSLIVIQNMPFLGNRVARFVLDPSGTRAQRMEVLPCGLPEGLIPYTGAVAGDRLFVNGTALFDLLEKGEPPPLPPVVVAVPL